MELVLALGIGALVGSGVWLLQRPRTYQLIVGLSLIGYGVNLFIFSMGRLKVDAAPVLAGGGAPDPAAFADPIPQALVLTAIVIGFATKDRSIKEMQLALFDYNDSVRQFAETAARR